MEISGIQITDLDDESPNDVGRSKIMIDGKELILVHVTIGGGEVTRTYKTQDRLDAYRRTLAGLVADYRG